MPFDRSTDLSFLRVQVHNRAEITLTAGSGGASGPPVDLFNPSDIQINYLTLQFFNSTNLTEDRVTILVDGVPYLVDIMIDQGSGSAEQEISISFKTEIPKGSVVTASMISDQDLSPVDVIVFASGL